MPITTPVPILVDFLGFLIKGSKGSFRKNIAIDLRLYADYNQSGTVEETDANYNLRATYPGAILFFACKPFNTRLSSFKIHAEKHKIVSKDHLGIVTSLKLVHTKGLQKGDEVKLWMGSGEADRVMLFNDEKVGAKAILGKGVATEAKIKISSAKFSSVKLSMTAVLSPSVPKERVFVNIKVMRKGKEIFKDRCMFGMAPWLMPNTLANVTTVFVIKNGFTGGFISTLRGLLAKVGIPLIELKSTDALGIPEPNGDHWTQDMFELGVLTRKNDPFPVTLGSASVYPRRRPGVNGVWKDFTSLGNGMIKAEKQDGGSMNSFGNLEVTPPLSGFPLGRKYHGVVDTSVAGGSSHTDIEKNVRDFLDKERYQPVTRIPTNWLSVGHVDEFLSIIPVKSSATEFRILYASPGKAERLCLALQTAGRGGELICAGKGLGYEISVDDFIANRDDLKTKNRQIEKFIVDKVIKDILNKEWKLTATHFVPIPTLFNGSINGSGFLEDCIARSAGMVNCLVLGKDRGLLIMPKPFGPINAAGIDIFEKSAREDIARTTNMDVEFIDDWDEYHTLAGEVHCGTNVTREVPDELFTWWEKSLEIDGNLVNN